MIHRLSRAPARPRSAFTLIELLVVIAIILVLTALTAGAIVGLIGTQQQANTENLFRTLDAKLRLHWNYVVKQAKTETPTAGVQAMAGGNKDRALAIHTKLRLMQAFPESFAEITNPPYLNVPTYGNLLSDTRYTVSYQHGIQNYNQVAHAQGKAQIPPLDTESSVCLLLALAEARGGQDSVLKSDSIQSSIGDTDKDGLNEIVDSWGTAIRFKRFTGNTSPVDQQSAIDVDNLCPAPKTSGVYKDPSNQTLPLKINDPLDPKGTLGDPIWFKAQGLAYLSLFPAPYSKNLPAYPIGWYNVPYFQTAGGDKQFGTADDLFSYRLRLGGHGD